jgi:hypothetical protein
LAWNLPLAQVAKLPLWQASQLAEAEMAIDAYGTWLAGLPWAGGNPPVWHDAHRAATGTWVWLKLLGENLRVGEWHAMQLVEPTGTCVAGMPLAVPLPWQLTQFVAAVSAL